MDVKKVQNIKKPVKLRTIFIKYLFVFSIVTLFMIVVLGIFFSIQWSSGAILPTNYVEKQVLAAKDKIASSKTVTSNLIPDLCKYAVYTTRGNMISGNLSLRDAKKAWNLVKNSEKADDFPDYYLKISRKNQVCIIRYPLSMQFASPTLRSFLPSPGLLVILLFCFGFALEVVILAYTFGKKFTEKMSGLQRVAEKVQNQNLDFSIESSGIFEIDNALFSIDKMKEALKVSLKKQWELEQTRRQQIAALAHDIKTPITIVRGNVELLIETNQNGEQKEYTKYIAESTQEMEQYVRKLIEISKAEIGYVFCNENIDSEKYVDEIHRNINALSSAKKVKVDFSVKNLPQYFCGDYGLLKRAIMNVASNAVDHSPENGTIIFMVEGMEKHIDFIISDSGNGFSKEDLLEAKQQFYMGDSSRKSKSHYGMGLYIADSIVKQHNGRMEIMNSHVTQGAKVRICIPL